MVERASAAVRLEQLVGLIGGLVSAGLLLRLALKLLGASAESPFVRAVYDLTSGLIAPFTGTFGDQVAGRFVLEADTLLALLVYGLAASAIVGAIHLLHSGREAGVSD